MNNKPVAWRKVVGNVTKHYQYNEMGEGTPLYTHPSEHDLGIAEAIGFEKGHKSAEDMLRQQQAEIEALKKQRGDIHENGAQVIDRLDKMIVQQGYEIQDLQEWKRSLMEGNAEQQAEIEALKAGKIRAYDNGVEDGRKPNTNNEPVAWMNKEANVFAQHEEGAKNFGCTIPLYTHPVKELTDEEINEIVWQQNLLLGNDDLRKFARAILRKASE